MISPCILINSTEKKTVYDKSNYDNIAYSKIVYDKSLYYNTTEILFYMC